MAKKSIEELLESGKIKRFFRTDKNIITENGIYHVIQRAPGIEQLFVEDGDYLYFIGLLKKVMKEFKLRLFSFALLPNHLHMLLQIRDKNLSKAMQNLFSNYAMFFNRKYQRKGHVFGGKYRPILCNDETYLLVVSAYIHLNPIKAGLCSEMTKYRWTSVLPYMQEIMKNTFIDYKYILRMLDKDMYKARIKYRDFITQSRDVPYLSVVEDPNAPDIFLTKVFKFVKEKVRKVNRPTNIFSSFEEKLDLISNKKRLVKPEDKNARRYLIKQLRSRGYDISGIAKMLNVTRATVYSSLS